MKKRLSRRTDIGPFLQHILKLKRINRAGWISKAKINEPESVADHSFSVCAISMALSDMLGLDTERVLKMAILHDLPESITGDLLPGEVTIRQKRSSENRAISTILNSIDPRTRSEYKQLWKEYVSDSTEISTLVHTVDKLDMALQAKQYIMEGHPAHLLAEFSEIPGRYLQASNHNIISQIHNSLKQTIGKNNRCMQYFVALKIGEKRVKSAQDLLTRYTGQAMPALALKDTKDNTWEPVGEENRYAVVKEIGGYMIVICDKNGIAKSIAQWFTEDKKNKIVAKIASEENMVEYVGKLSLPI